MVGWTTAAIALAWTLIPIPAEWIEHYYARALFRWIGGCLVPLSSSVSVSFTAILLVVLIVWFVVAWWRHFRRAASRGEALRWGALRVLVAGFTVYVVFLLVWGAGYRRPPLEQRLGIEGDQPSSAELERFAVELLGVLRAQLDNEIDRDRPRALRSIRDAMVELVGEWDGSRPAVPPAVKELPPGTLLSTGSSGVTSPFRLEPHVDGGLPDAAFLSVAAHELAHVAGYCRESDADFVADVAGLRSRDRFARYATALSLFRQTTAQLETAKRDALRAQLPAAARDDLRRAREAYVRYTIPWLSNLQSTIYDSYLKSQGVEDGVANYSRGVVLVLRAWQAGKISRLDG